MNIRPLQNRIIVKRAEEKDQTSGGLFIPTTAQEKPLEGEVLAVGCGKVSDEGNVRPMDIKKGDAILFSKYAGTEIVVDGQKLLILTEDEILGVRESE